MNCLDVLQLKLSTYNLHKVQITAITDWDMSFLNQRDIATNNWFSASRHILIVPERTAHTDIVSILPQRTTSTEMFLFYLNKTLAQTCSYFTLMKR